MESDTDFAPPRGAPNERPAWLVRLRNWVQAPLSKTMRGLLLLGGIVLPVVSHWVALEGVPILGPHWQSNHLHDQVGFILTSRAGFVFYPLILLAIVSLAWFIFTPPHRHRSLWMVFGIVNGVLVSLWYLIIFAICFTSQKSFDAASILLTVGALIMFNLLPLVLWLIIGAVKWTCRKLRQPYWLGGVVSLALYLLITGTAVMGIGKNDGVREWLLQAVVTPLIAGVVLAPVWSWFTYSFVALRLLLIERSIRQLSLLQLMGLMTYATGLIAACRTSVILSLRAYSQLPVEKQGCYIATAAASGHARLVGACRPVGAAVPINRQLQVLKAFEIALASIHPATHRKLRGLYNIVGPPLAGRLDRPWKADLAYLSLKPAEWLAELTLWALLRHDCDLIEQLYHPAESSASGTPRE